ncbi:hypothetical protein BU23DRAFT_41740 [Bimuria novae-zelandiae CBS 107.79]|uniref:Uncharacterized protein n=1 Tax=Bimuria novae-zelandiae CBS 107.79 TaxID=1447943 RepID=A0A6A5VG53_9PLEO|nr:hypothetical protein BU23DRAFT_41740 [Bimuria novae-zelandiae CBS 107.79]
MADSDFLLVGDDGSTATAPRIWKGKENAADASVYIHRGGHDTIPAHAPPAMLFLASYIQIVNGPNTPHRQDHFAPHATVQSNDGLPVPASRLLPLLKVLQEIPMTFSHTLKHVWAVSEDNIPGPKETLLVD